MTNNAEHHTRTHTGGSLNKENGPEKSCRYTHSGAQIHSLNLKPLECPVQITKPLALLCFIWNHIKNKLLGFCYGYTDP